MSRPSSIYRTRTSMHRTSMHRPHHQDPFPMLDSKEITICLQSCEFLATEELVSKPTSQFMRSLTEQLLDTFMGVSGESMDNKLKLVSHKKDEESKDESKEGPRDEFDDTIPSLHLTILFRHAWKFYQMCGINDFSLMDIAKPDPQRIRRILSAVVNFARFREENSIDCEELVNVSENNLDRVKQIQLQNTEMSNKIIDLQNSLNSKKSPSLHQINSYNTKLESELKRLKKIQELLTLEHSEYKQEKLRLIEKLEDHNYLIIESSKELDNLKNYNQFDMELIQKVIEDLKANLATYNETLNGLEQKNRNVGITIESFQIIEQELKNLFRILEEILGDINKEDELSDKLIKFQEFLDQQKLESNDLNRQIQQIKRQLVNLDEKIKKLRVQSQDRNENSKQRLSELKQSYNKLVEERTVKESELDKRKELINDLETQMNNKRTAFQNEIRNSELAVARLNSHLKLYLTEMNKKL